MILRKKYYLITFFLILIIQLLLYTNNNQKTSFRYFKWTLREVGVGKLISISFFSGLCISAFFNNTIITHKINTDKNIEENFEPDNNEEDIKANIEMPPQRDIRDTQPTISVNYRVVRNVEENNSNSYQDSSEYPNNEDDWNKDKNDW